jgi:ubiquinone/menaquinone biosynthesis C-methylase UbiE
MEMTDRQVHWDAVYRTRDETGVSWFQENPALSLDLIHATGANAGSSIVDVGGGSSRLVDRLLDEGSEAVTVLDISSEALAIAKKRLGVRATRVQWIVADVTTWAPTQLFDVWHDRAAFHFLTDPSDRAAYAATVSRAVAPNGHVIIATFALDGPERCSGLPISRHDSASLAAVLGRSFKLIESRRQDHSMPSGGVQRFQFSRFQRTE